MKAADNTIDNSNKHRFSKKLFYFAVHFPLIGLFCILGFYIYSFNLTFLLLYIFFALISILFQSYCCAFQECPYIGFPSFCPGIGGFLILSSYLTLFVKKLPKSKRWFNLSASIAGLSAFVFVIYPVFFLIKLNLLYPLLYLLLTLVYIISFFSLICPGCAIVKICPGGVFSRKIRKCDNL